MALIQCRECGKSVSTEALTCPHCGAPQREPAPPLLSQRQSDAPEETLHSDKIVTVTTTRVIIWGTTYALRNITSVKMASTSPPIAGAILLLLFGVFVLLLTTLPFNENNYHPIPGFILGGVIIVGSIVWMCSRKTDYHIHISSASGEIHALTAKDKAYIQRIVQSINDAIVKYR